MHIFQGLRRALEECNKQKMTNIHYFLLVKWMRFECVSHPILSKFFFLCMSEGGGGHLIFILDVTNIGGGSY